MSESVGVMYSGSVIPGRFVVGGYSLSVETVVPIRKTHLMMKSSLTPLTPSKYQYRLSLVSRYLLSLNDPQQVISHDIR